MLSSPRANIFKLSLVAALFAVSSCGKMDAKEKTLLPGRDMGCYDKLGERVSRYFNGQIEVAEWEDTFDCVSDQLTFFKKYVRGQTPEGYNQADIGALVRKFLIVNRPVSDQFIASLFDLKASVFGGSSGVITMHHIDEFLRLSEALRRETVALLPALQARKRNPSSANILKLSDDIGAFGANMATFFETLKGRQIVHKDSYLPFVRELLVIHGGDSSLVDKYEEFARSLKVVIAGGKSDAIESEIWPILIQEGAAMGGLLLASRDMDTFPFTRSEDKDVFEIELSKRVQTILTRVIAQHGSGIPLSSLDPVIDSLPSDTLTVTRRVAIKKDLRPIVYKVLKSGAKNWLTASSVRRALDLYREGMRSQVHLKKIYRGLPENLSSKDFEVAARKYLARMDTKRDREEVNTLIEISKSFVGLFAVETAEMQFTNARRETRTKNHMIRMSWFKLLIRHAFSIYATGPEISSGMKSARMEDLAELTVDFLNILKEWKLAHPELTPTEMATKRFREGNLFMPNSDGDSYFDQIEATYYVAFLFSSGAFSGRIYSRIRENSREWSACPIVGVDELGQDAFDPNCFRRVYFGNPKTFWANFPGLQVAYAKMTTAEKATLANSMEIAARRGGYSEKPIGPFDIDSFAALPHYVEDIMERFDVNDNEMLDKQEILEVAYPIFKETLSKAARGQKSNVLLKGILTYIIRYGVPPSNTIKLLAWVARLPFTNVTADRNALYKVVAILSSPLDMTKNTTGSSWPIEEGDLFPTVTAQETSH